MKIHNLNKILLALCIPIWLLSCSESSFLDLKDPNRFTDKDFWVNAENAESALATAYAPLQFQMSGWFGATTGFLDQQSRGDETWTVLGEEAPSWQIATFTNTNQNEKYTYSELYTGIQRTNVILNYIHLIPSHAIKDEHRESLKGEAYFLRGYQYFLLTNHYQEVPLRLKPSQDEQYKEAATHEALWLQIEDDLTNAIASGLPIKRSAEQAGRIEQGAAVMLLAKVYATQHKYDKAKLLLEDLQKSPYNYGLMRNYEDNFVPTTEHNQESIFEIVYGEGDYSWGNGGLSGQGNSLPQWIGSPASGGWMKLAPSALIASEFIKEKKSAGKVSEYGGRNFDERMYGSLYFDSKLYGDEQDESKKWYGGAHTFNHMWELAMDNKLNRGAPNYPSVGGAPGRFLTKKYTAFFDPSSQADQMTYKPGKKNNVRVIRFAETLLLYAEACYKTGDERNANVAITAIRERAGLDKREFSGTVLWEEIVHQNMLEFYNEGRRFEDLKRWYTAAEISQIFVTNKKQGAEFFEPKHLYYPIPLRELQINLLMKQNSAWK